LETEQLTLHFEAEPGTDLNAASAALQEALKTLPAVQSVETTGQEFQAIGPAEVMSVIQVGTQLLQSTAAFLSAAAAVYAAWQKVRPMFPGLCPPKMEVGMQQVPVNELAEQHRAALVSD
jgi:hypothetical protein